VVDELVEVSLFQPGSPEEVRLRERLAFSFERIARPLVVVGTGLFSPLPERELRLDHLEGQEVVPLLGEDEADALQILLVELPVAAFGAGRRDEPLGLEETQLRYRDVWKLVP